MLCFLDCESNSAAGRKGKWKEALVKVGRCCKQNQSDVMTSLEGEGEGDGGPERGDNGKVGHQQEEGEGGSGWGGGDCNHLLQEICL